MTFSIWLSYKFKDFYKNCKFVAQPDRKGHTDFITYSGGVKMASDKFKKEAKKIYKIFDYKDEKGIATDVDTLVKNHIGLSCFNISCGYYRAHDSTEVVDIEVVDIAYNIINMLFDNLKEQYPYKHVPKPPVNNYSNKYDYGNYGGSYSYLTHFADEAEKKSVRKADDSSESSYGLNRVIYDNKYKLFAKVQDTRFYKLLEEDSVIHMTDFNKSDNSGKISPMCTKCKERGTIYFIQNENSFFCISCNDFIKSKVLEKYLRKHLYIVDNGTKFYHFKALNRWIHEDEAIFDENISTYRLK